MKPSNIFDAIPEQLTHELFDTLIHKDGVRIERIVSKGHCAPQSAWYDQDQDEWVIVLQGQAIIRYPSGQEEHLQAGSYLNIPAHTKHQVSWTSPKTATIWLAIFYGPLTTSDESAFP